MLSARAIALQGIGFSLTPIMLAVLGLLAEEEDIQPGPVRAVGHSFGRPVRGGKRRVLTLSRRRGRRAAPPHKHRGRARRALDILFLRD